MLFILRAVKPRIFNVKRLRYLCGVPVLQRCGDEPMWKEVLRRMVSRDIAVVVSTSESTKMNMYRRSAVVFVIAHTLLLAEHLSPEQVDLGAGRAGGREWVRRELEGNGAGHRCRWHPSGATNERGCPGTGKGGVKSRLNYAAEPHRVKQLSRERVGCGALTNAPRAPLLRIPGQAAIGAAGCRAAAASPYKTPCKAVPTPTRCLRSLPTRAARSARRACAAAAFPPSDGDIQDVCLRTNNGH
jgi:hypothetical protein